MSQLLVTYVQYIVKVRYA